MVARGDLYSRYPGITFDGNKYNDPTEKLCVVNDVVVSGEIHGNA